MRKGLSAYYSAEGAPEPRPKRLVYLLVISVVLHVCILWFVQYPSVSSKVKITNPLRVTIKSMAPVQVARQGNRVTPAKAVSPPTILNSVPAKPRLHAAQLISRSLEQVRHFEEKPLPGFNTTITDKRVIETRIEAPVSIFSHASEARQYRRTDGNIWIKMASIFGGYQCFVVRPADPLDSFDHGAWYMTRC